MVFCSNRSRTKQNRTNAHRMRTRHFNSKRAEKLRIQFVITDAATSLVFDARAAHLLQLRSGGISWSGLRSIEVFDKDDFVLGFIVDQFIRDGARHRNSEATRTQTEL